MFSSTANIGAFTMTDFLVVRDWRDPSWSPDSVRHGLDLSILKQRLTLFGKNELEIQAKSTPSLLVEEVIMIIDWTACEH